MKLQSIKLTNFRCFQRIEVPLHPRLTVIVGNNGAGKTAILDGIGYALARILSRLPEIASKDLRRDDIRMTGKSILSPYVRIEAESTSQIVWSRTRKRDPSRQTSEQIPEASGDKALYEHIDPIVHAVAEGREENLPVFSYYGVSRAVLDIPQRERAFKKEFSRFQALESALEPTARFKELFEWFYAKQFQELLAEYGTDDPAELPKAQSSLKAVKHALGMVVPGFSSPTLLTEPLRLVLKQKLADGTELLLPLQMLSDGYRTMIAMVMDFARRLAQANPHLADPLTAEAILIVDEVDLHLHPRWQQTVLPTLQRAFPNTQLIVTTHSPQVLTTAPAESILILEDNILHTAQVPSFGARSSDLVETVMGLQDLRPPDNEITQKIIRLFEEIDSGNLLAAKAIREELRSWQNGLPEPDMARADLLLRQLEARSGGK